MQTNVLDAICENVQICKNIQTSTKFTFVINKDKANDVIGGNPELLKANGYMIKNVNILFVTHQVVVVRHNYYSDFNGWISQDEALMISCIKGIYMEDTLIYNDGAKE